MNGFVELFSQILEQLRLAAVNVPGLTPLADALVRTVTGRRHRNVRTAFVRVGHLAARLALADDWRGA